MTLESACVRLAAEINLATILGDSEEGMNLEEIAKATKVDGLKLGIEPFLLCPLCLLTIPNRTCFTPPY